MTFVDIIIIMSLSLQGVGDAWKMFLLVARELDAAGFEYLQIQRRGHFNYKLLLDATNNPTTSLIGTNNTSKLQPRNFLAQNYWKISFFVAQNTLKIFCVQTSTNSILRRKGSIICSSKFWIHSFLFFTGKKDIWLLFSIVLTLNLDWSKQKVRHVWKSQIKLDKMRNSQWGKCPLLLNAAVPGGLSDPPKLSFRGGGDHQNFGDNLHHDCH